MPAPRRGRHAASQCWHVTFSSHSSIITTMNKKELNPNIRVTAETRKDLKIIAAHEGETMLEVVARLAKHERERIQKGDATHAQNV